VNKKIIIIDVDDVVVENHHFPIINKYLEKIGKPTFKDTSGFRTNSIRKEVFKTPEELNDFVDFFLQFDSYEKLNSILGAIEAVKHLNGVHDVYLVTASLFNQRTVEMGRCMVDKLRWITTHLPFLHIDKIIFSSKKHLFNADVIIDDKIDNLCGNYKTKILFTAFLNKHITKKELDKAGIVRADNWDEVIRIINEGNE